MNFMRDQNKHAINLSHIEYKIAKEIWNEIYLNYLLDGHSLNVTDSTILTQTNSLS